MFPRSRLGKTNFCLIKKPSNSKAIHDGSSLYGNCKIIFTISGSSLVLSSKIELFVTVVICFQLQIVVTKTSILDAGGDQDRSLIRVFGKVIIHLVQANVIQFKLIVIYGGYEGSCLYGNCKVILYQRIQDLDCMLASV